MPRGGAVRTSAMFGGYFKSDEAGKTRKRYQKRVDEINSFESQFQGMSDEELKAQTPQLQQRAQAGEALESLLPEAFAVRRSRSCIRHLSYGLNTPVWCIPPCSDRSCACACDAHKHVLAAMTQRSRLGF